ncbi:ABC transporter ATP-binding protein [uncultured Enterovirga sp.]|uniref:ABC transporter ATP-binding protein n=1 Tax=uncultured Enterovirga sp. TaxID=2026352 RepID=UPI0035CC80CD
MNELLRVENLTTWLSTGAGIVTAVDDVSFTVAAGRTLALVGESGSGKSMTCSSILRLLPGNGHVGGGRVLFEGEDLLTKTPAEMQAIRGRKIGMIVQDPMTSLNPLFDIEDQVGEMFKYHLGDRTAAVRRPKVVEALGRVRIPAADKRLGSYPHEFSGGMRQRVAIALNIACTPKLLIADEPTTALDVTVQQQILGLLRDIQRETGMAIILVTHDLHTVARFCDEVAIMYAGRIVEQGPVAEIFARPAHPYTEGLLRALPSLGTGAERLPLISGQPPSPSSLPPGCRFEPRCPRATEHCRQDYPAWFGTDDLRRRSACWYADEVVG